MLAARVKEEYRSEKDDNRGNQANSHDSLQLPGRFADVVISNCVINLCSNKKAVYEEAYRILRPGGRLAISDIILIEVINPHLQKRFQESWSGCLGGAVPVED